MSKVFNKQLKKQIGIFTLFLLSLSSYAQIEFENGYYINNSNERILCQIKNLDWRKNPSEFEYRLLEKNKAQKATIKTVKEFGIDNITKFVRRIVEIDRSSDEVYKLSDDINPKFNQEELFLKILVQGENTLLEYADGNLRRYFYEKQNMQIKQLVFKRYESDENKINENNEFRQQLWNDLKCANIKISDLQKVKYTKKDLVNFFIKQSDCNKDKLIYFEQKQKRDLFNLSLRPRLNSTPFSMENSVNDRNFEFENQTNFGFGIEAEFILPYNKNKWSIFIEPSYQSFKANKSFEVDYVNGGEILVEVQYKSIEIPIGLRRYFFINKNSKIFLNASIIFDSGSNSFISFKRNDGSPLNTLDIKTPANFAIGIGYKQSDRVSLEIRKQTNRSLLNDYQYWGSNYSTLSFILGYSFF